MRQMDTVENHRHKKSTYPNEVKERNEIMWKRRKSKKHHKYHERELMFKVNHFSAVFELLQEDLEMLKINILRLLCLETVH